MMRRLSYSGLLSTLLILAPTLALAQPAADFEKIDAVRLGEPFPGGTFDNVNPMVEQRKFDLSDSLGKKPVLLMYWIPGNPRADEMFQGIQELVTETGDKVALYGLFIERPGRGVDAAVKSIVELGITVPVLNDLGFRLGQQLRVQSVPNLTIIDSGGVLRLTNGASLQQVLEYKMDLSAAIRRVGDKGTLATYGYLPRYYPAQELIGQRCPDFEAPLLSNSVEQRWSRLIDDTKVNVLIFWSVDCPHCQKTLPELSEWLKENSDGLNVFSAARVTNEATKVKTKEFCDLYGLSFPTLVDQDLEIAELYQVIATPTTIIIKPDGTIEAVLVTDDIPRVLAEKKRKLL
jgi:peroxiredoxin